jgi:hypothetical protein
MSNVYVEVVRDGETEIHSAAEWLFSSELTPQERCDYDEGHADGVAGTIREFASPAYMDGWVDAQPYK